MSEAAISTDDVADDATAPAGAPRRPSKKMLVIGGIALLLLVALGIGAWLWLGKSGKGADHADPATAAGEPGEVYVEIPAMLVNLRSTDGTARLIKIRLTLVAADPDMAAGITARLPRIIDSFQPFLRELRPEDLAGSAAVFRIKEELLIRANAMTGPGSVKQVLVQDLIQQ